MTSGSKVLLSEKMFYEMSMIMAPNGIGAIIDSSEFKWISPDWNERVEDDIIAQWPGFVNEDTDDYIGLGLWASRKQFPADPMKLTGVQLIDLGKIGRRATWETPHLVQRQPESRRA
jgi:hypothetical protein